jgi:hypothetical protein
MSVETQNNAKTNNPFGDKKITQAECAMFVQQALQPFVNHIKMLNNAIDVLYGYLQEVGIGGDKVTQAEIVAYAQSKNNGAAQKANGTNS